MSYQRHISVSIAFVVVIVCGYLRTLAFGWLLVLLGFAYLPLLFLHIFVHLRYAGTIPLTAKTVTAIVLSHLRYRTDCCSLEYRAGRVRVSVLSREPHYPAQHQAIS
jgi:hypothetical protein